MQRLLLFLLLHCTGATPLLAVSLYDVSLGTVPGAQSWVSFVKPGGSISFTGSAARFNTSSSFGVIAGIATEFTAGGLFPHPLMPVLDRHDGFEVRFALQVLSEAHNLNRDDNGDGLLDRAGFSIIIISQDLAGIEVAFFADKIWVYEDALTNSGNKFTQAENVLFDTTAATNYKLVGTADGYTLYADGVNLLSGPWRNYNPSGVNPIEDPYDNPSFLFLGDNTRSASSEVLLGNIAVVVGPFPEFELSPVSVPMPIPALGLLAYLLLIIACKRGLLARHYGESTKNDQA